MLVSDLGVPPKIKVSVHIRRQGYDFVNSITEQGIGRHDRSLGTIRNIQFGRLDTIDVNQ